MVAARKLAAVEEWTLDADVPLDEIILDTAYGREPNAGHLEKLSKGWNPKKVGVILLSLRKDGFYACLDGWHRVTVAREKGVRTLPARVYIDLVRQEEAELFVAFNRDVRLLTPGEKFKARLDAREPVAVEIDYTLAKLGLSMMTRGDPGSARIGEVRCLMAVENVFSVRGAAHLTEVMALLKEAYGNSPNSFTHFSVGGASTFLVRYGEGCPVVADWDRVVNILRTTTLKGMDSAMRQLQSVLLGTNPYAAWGMSLRLRYNRNLRGGRTELPEWVVRVMTPEMKAESKVRLASYASAAGKKGAATTNKQKKAV